MCPPQFVIAYGPGHDSASQTEQGCTTPLKGGGCQYCGGGGGVRQNSSVHEFQPEYVV